MDSQLSTHAEQRLQQRGLREEDIELLMQFGTRLDDHCFLMRNKDVQREIIRRKREIQALERLRGVKIVCDGDLVITAYRPARARLKRDLRRAA